VRLLDLFCCQGGASAGYAAAGFDVTGVDLQPQPRYPYRFIRADALDYARHHAAEYDAVHASPPCQAHSNAQRIRNRAHPELIAPLRDILVGLGIPYIIENVVGAPLIDPVELCGSMFALRTYRHRIFESSITLTAPVHPPHQRRQTKMGRALRDGDWYHAVGNFSNVGYVRRDMQVPWMNRDGIRESIPPAYARHVGHQLMESLTTAKAVDNGHTRAMPRHTPVRVQLPEPRPR
jgi:DNA (cytosine-5)-methyltransferase 1